MNSFPTAVRPPTDISSGAMTLATYGTVLVVDDDHVSRQILHHISHAAGASRVIHARDGLEALEILEAETPDLVVLDIRMPRLDGIETCRRLRLDDRHANTPVLIQSALNDPGTRARGFAAGATDVVSKPLDVDETKARLRVHLENQLLVKSLAAFRARMDVHLTLAAKLAKSLVPGEDQIRRVEASTGLSIEAIHRPKEEVGGDFWLVREIEDGGALLMIVDCVGHGVAAAMNSFRTEAILRGITATDPGTLLSELDDRLAQIGDGFLTAAATAVHYDPATHVATLCVAGAPRALLLTGAEVQEITSGGLPLGSGLFRPRSASLSLAPGNGLLLYSDGWATGDSEVAIRLLSPAIAAGEWPCLAALAGEEPLQEDDMTLVLIRRSEP